MNKIFNKNNVTTALGFLAAIGTVLSQMGIHVGHVGSVDGNTAVAATALTILGYYTAKPLAQ